MFTCKENNETEYVTPKINKGLTFVVAQTEKESACNARDLSSIRGLKGSPGSPLQDSCLENIPWTEEPGGLQSMGSQRVRYY